MQYVAVDEGGERAETRLVTIGEAIKDALGSRTQKSLATALDIDPAQVTRIIKGQATELPLERVAAIEDELGLDRGELLRRAGYVDDGVSVEGAIAVDDDLWPGTKRALVSSYRALLLAQEEALTRAPQRQR